MLLDRRTRQGIRDGSISLVFRRWKRPTVKAGGSILTAVGRLGIAAVDPVSLDDIRAADAEAAGFASVAALREFLDREPGGTIYRIRLGKLQPDPRIALRDEVPAAAEMAAIISRLKRMDERSLSGPWTEAALSAIARQPAVRAADIAESFPQELRHFKANIRKLKALGLTESLEIGYRLSPRGEAVLAELNR